MWIFVKSGLDSSEKKRIDNIRPTDKVEHLKVLLASALGMEVKRMRVFHKGKTLEDGHCLHEYSIKQDETLQVFPRPPTPEPETIENPAGITSSTMPPLVTTSTESESGSDGGPDVLPGTRVFTPEHQAKPEQPELASPPPTDWQQYREKPYDEEELALLRSIRFPCDKCIQDPRRPCIVCGCHICQGKEDEDRTIVCDECNMFYHWACLEPELTELPEDDWFCADCKNDTSHVILPGQALPKKQKPGKEYKDPKTKKWGNGNANVGRTKVCTIVGQHHFGSIPGVEVGQTWLFRMQVSESGIHRPPVGGISGSAKMGSQSIVLGGGYKEDVDNGDSFLYTGSGGRELGEGKGRTAKVQSSDQKLAGVNYALAMTCDAPVDPAGAIAADWTQSKPVRVVRGYKMKKHSTYAPDTGFRYDGIYKLVRYWPEKGSDGYIVIRYEFRRDDPSPAPWTEEGKQRIEELGLEMIYPDNYQPQEGSKGKKRNNAEPEANTEQQVELVERKKVRKVWKPQEPLLQLIAEDHINTRLWSSMLALEPRNEREFLEKLVEELACPVCMDFVHYPITTICGHNICKNCLEGSLVSYGQRCPSCRTDLVKGPLKVNAQLVACIRTFEPGYSS